MADEQIMVISVMDRDRPGIVAEVTESISSLGGNLADLRESVLCGYFTMIVIACFSKDTSAQQVEQTLGEAMSSKVSVILHEGSLANEEHGEHAYILSASGRDRVGLVAQMSRFCCDRSVNILDLASHVEGDQYTMMLQLDFSGIQSIETFEKELADFGEKTGLKCVLQHHDIFRATNEI